MSSGIVIYGHKLPSESAGAVRRPFVIWLPEVVGFENTGQPSDTYTANVDHSSTAEVVNVGRDPSTVEKFLQIVRCFMVAADENGQNRRDFLARVVLVERPHLFVLVWDSHTC